MLLILQEKLMFFNLLWHPWPWWFSTGQWEGQWRRWPAPQSWFRCPECTAAPLETEILQIWWSAQIDLLETVCCSKTGYLRRRRSWGQTRVGAHCSNYSPPVMWSPEYRLLRPYRSWRRETQRCCAQWRQRWWVPAGMDWFPGGPPSQRLYC